MQPAKGQYNVVHMNTNLRKGLETAKIDSVSIKIQEESCLTNSTGINRRIAEVDLEDGNIYSEKILDETSFMVKGVPTTIKLCKQELKNNDPIKFYRLNFNAKQLGSDKYNEGLTIENVVELFDEIQETSGIQFKKNAILKARFEDLDICWDTWDTIEQWNTKNHQIIDVVNPKLLETHVQVFEAKKPNTPLLRKIKPGDVLSGIQFNHRQGNLNRKVNFTTPMVKRYCKALDQMMKQITGDLSLQGYEAGERKRLEAQIKNNYWVCGKVLTQLAKPICFEHVLIHQREKNHILSDYITGVISRQYCDQKEPKTRNIRDMHSIQQEGPQEWLLREVIEAFKEESAKPEKNRKSISQLKTELKDKAGIIFNKEKAYKIRLLIDREWEATFGPETGPNQTGLKL